MDRNKVIEILKDFNDYRRNKGVYDTDKPCEPKFKASEIGEAIDMAINSLKDSNGRATVLEAVCAEACVSLDELKSKSRKREIVVARNAAAWLLRKEGYTLMEVGDIINRSHGNVLHQCEEVGYWLLEPGMNHRELQFLERVQKRMGLK